MPRCHALAQQVNGQPSRVTNLGFSRGSLPLGGPIQTDAETHALGADCTWFLFHAFTQK
jgi:hypothetical protein